MKIGIVGGTGGMGEGLALRWCLNHDIIVGSRDAKRAAEAAATYSGIVSSAYGSTMKGSLRGDDNTVMAKECDLIVLSIPFEHIDDTCSKLMQAIRDDCIVICPIVPMRKGSDGFEYVPISSGGISAAELVARKMPPRPRIVSSLHTISEMKLKQVGQSLDCDTLLCGDDPAVVGRVRDLISEISGLRPLYIGPLAMAYQAEVMTPMLLNAARQNKIKNPGLRIV